MALEVLNRLQGEFEAADSDCSGECAAADIVMCAGLVATVSLCLFGGFVVHRSSHTLSHVYN